MKSGFTFKEGRTSHIEEETKLEKNFLARRQRIVSVVTLISSTVVMSLAWTYLKYDTLAYPWTSFGILGVFAIIYSILTFAWSCIYAKLTDGAENPPQANKLEILGSILFLVGALISMIGIILVLAAHIMEQSTLDRVLANNPVQEFESIKGTLKVLLYLTSVFTLITLIPLGATMYNTYTISVRPDYARYYLHILNLIWVFVTCFTLFLGHAANKLADSKIAPGSTNFYFVNALVAICITSLATSLILFAANTFRYKPSLLAIGAGVLLITFCNLSLTGLIVRNSDLSRNELIDNCSTKMKYASEHHLREWKCSEKYLKVENVLSLNCEEEWMAEAWEYEKPGSSPKIGCLNRSCCDIFADSYSIWLQKSAVSSLANAVISFAIVCSCFWLAFKASYSSTGKKFDWILGIFLVALLIILPLIGYLSISGKFINEKQIVYTESEKSKNEMQDSNSIIQIFASDDIKMTGNKEIKRFDEDYALEQKACAAFSQLQKISLSNDKILCPGKICGHNTGHRISIIGKNGDFYIKNDFNYKKIKVFSEDVRNQIFPSERNLKDSFISFEGTNSDIHHFLANELKFCLRPATEYVFIIDAYQVDLDRQPLEDIEYSGNTLPPSSANISSAINFMAQLPIQSAEPEEILGQDLDIGGTKRMVKGSTVTIQRVSDDHIFSDLVRPTFSNNAGAVVEIPYTESLDFEHTQNVPEETMGSSSVKQGESKSIASQEIPQSSNHTSQPQIEYSPPPRPLSEILASLSNMDNKNNVVTDGDLIMTSPAPRTETALQKPTLEENESSLGFEKSFYWGNLVMKIVDLETNSPLAGVQVGVLPERRLCGTEEEEPLYDQISDEKGEVKFFNLQLKDYTVFAKKRGFKMNCVEIGIKKVNENTIQTLGLLNSEMNKKLIGYLSWNQGNKEGYNLELGATFSHDSLLKCHSGFYSSSCSGMTFKSYEFGQTIEFDVLGPYYYLLYVQKFPSNKDKIKKNYMVPKPTLSENEKSENLQDNFLLLEADPKITFFVPELNHPVASVKLPKLSLKVLEDPIITWLGVCFKGGIGFTSYRPVNKFWMSGKENVVRDFWSRHPQDDGILPEAEVCEVFFKNLEKPAKKGEEGTKKSKN